MEQEYNIRRGDIFYISRTPVIGCEQFSGRPAIVVSCDVNNKTSETVEVVYLTTRIKANLPTHVAIQSAKFPSTALCEQVTTVSIMRIGDYYGTCTREEMARIDSALATSLGIHIGAGFQGPRKENHTVVATMTCAQNEKESLASVKAERDTYHAMFESLLAKVICAAQSVDCQENFSV